MDTEEKLKRARGAAQRRFDEITRFIVDGENNLCELLVNAWRLGYAENNIESAFGALEAAILDARMKFKAAIAHPEPRLNRERIVL